MNVEDQTYVLKTMAHHIIGAMVEEIRSGKVPAEWDAVELHWWLAARVAEDPRLPGNLPRSRADLARRRRFFRAMRDNWLDLT